MDKIICLINSSFVASSSFPEACINVITAYNNPKKGNPTTTIFIIWITTCSKSTSLLKIYDDMIIIYTSSITDHIIPSRYLDKELKNNFIEKINRWSNNQRFIQAIKFIITLFIDFQNHQFYFGFFYLF